MRELVLSIFLSASFALSTFSSLHACEENGKSGIVEENNLWIDASAKGVSTLTHEEFDRVISRIEKIYAPVVAARGGQLDIERNWDNGTVNAYAQQLGNIWKVSMFGGLARHETITPDGFALVVCHELGHHIGGAPKKSTFWSITWASNEGQADYFGNMKCMRRYMEDDDNITIVSDMNVPTFASEKCQQVYSDPQDVAICKRTAMAGLSLGNLFRALKNLPSELKFSTPDPARVGKTFHGHPEPQCRLDTYFQAALCEKGPQDEVSDQDENQGVCNNLDKDEMGIRPLCWFKPQA